LRLRVVSSIIGRSLKVTDFIFIIFGAGAELKTVADALTGRMLRCEVAEGKHVHDKWEFEDVYQHTTATCMRLAEPWFNSGRIFCGDSWFGSVQSAIAHAKNGVHFIGLVKTAHSGFPKKQLLSKLKDKPIGTVVTMVAEIMNVKLIACGYKETEEMDRCYISTCGTTDTQEHDCEVQDDTTGVIKRSKQRGPKIHCEFRRASPKIDIHNMKRQGIMRIERIWITHRYAHRLFATIGIGMTATNVVLDIQNNEGYATNVNGTDDQRFMEHIKRLAFSLMHNKYLKKDQRIQNPMVLRTSPAKKTAGASPLQHTAGADNDAHPLSAYSKLYGFPTRFQLSCDVCGKKATTYCTTCGIKTAVCANDVACQQTHSEVGKSKTKRRMGYLFSSLLENPRCQKQLKLMGHSCAGLV
jgi:hypothetical protein